MDEIDEEIIAAVRDGTIRYSTIAKKLGLPLSTVHFRVKRLEKSRIIKHYKGDIDWKLAGFPLLAYIFINIDVNLLKGLKKTQKKLLEELLRIPYVEEGAVITGDSDMLLKVIARDPEHLSKILMGYIDSKEGIVKTKTVIALPQ
jgi:DNA-binding Lrp family transcriptional regulator